MFFMSWICLASRRQKAHKWEPIENRYNVIILHRDISVGVGTSLGIVETGLGKIIEENEYLHSIYMNNRNSFNGIKLQMTWDTNFF